MLYNNDCLQVLPTLKERSIDMIFADPPYFLSNNGLSIKSGKVVSVNKGDWDKKENYEDTDKFTKEWIQQCYNVLKDTGTIWVSGTSHNIFDIQKYLKEVGFKIINIIVWHKSDPPPLIYKNKFKFSYELIIWAKKSGKHCFNYKDMFDIDTDEMQDVWTIPAVQMHEKKFGYHPTQKPEELLERIISSCTKKADIVLDPFMGSGTTCYVAKKLGRDYIGIEKDDKFYDIANKRVK
ncbi:MAG: site-specific DNA-methyltransferase [bacterium]